jgi:hypothetical protein
MPGFFAEPIRLYHRSAPWASADSWSLHDTTTQETARPSARLPCLPRTQLRGTCRRDAIRLKHSVRLASLPAGPVAQRAAAAAGFGQGAPVAAIERVVEAGLQALDAETQGVAGGGVDDVAAGAVVEVEEVDEELGDSFVFAGLAGEDEEEFEASAMEDALQDGAGGLELVGSQGELEDQVGEGIQVGEQFQRSGGGAFVHGGIIGGIGGGQANPRTVVRGERGGIKRGGRGQVGELQDWPPLKDRQS